MTQERGSPGNRTLNLRIKSPFPGCFRCLPRLYEIVHRRRSWPHFPFATAAIVFLHFVSRACRNRVAFL
jgi:hypothetical protein